MKKVVFANEEIYHVYGRGVDKRKIYSSPTDYKRFISLLYLSRSPERFEIRKLKEDDILKIPIGNQMVEILEWCLMPNHFHLILRQKTNGGISKFMQKVMTGYTMYYNLHNMREGSLFSSTFRAKHVGDDIYFRKVREYVRLNPLEIYVKDWEKSLDQDDLEINHRQLEKLKNKHLKDFKYTSLNKFFKL